MSERKTQLPRDDPRHGTANGYSNWRCRCDECRTAVRDRHREYTHRTGRRRPMEVYLAERFAEPPPHGTESRYTGELRCRCDLCRAAAATARRERRHADPDATRAYDRAYYERAKRKARP